MATAKRNVRKGIAGKIPIGDVTPEEAAAIRASVTKKEQAPSSRQQTAIFGDWRKTADQLGSPFEVERIPLSKLRAMRRDPILGFGLSFTKTPHVRAKWYINAKSPKGANAQVAAHLDHDLRRIYPSFVLQALNCLDFGFQAITKRFELRTPSGTFIETNADTGEQEEKPIWSEGGIQPVGWKPFVALPPEQVQPIWNSQGEFDGISVAPPEGAASAAPTGAQGGSDKVVFDVDLYHSLWMTNEKDANFGNIFGYPRLGYAYRYWWSYWFRWAIADRAFERKADPSVLVKHPDGSFLDDATGETVRYNEYALAMGERMRSGGVIALPSEVYEDANGRGTTPLWSIEFTKDAVNFEPFDESFDYLDIGKLRSLFIPEQAFMEGKGGTSSRNVAAEMGDSFTESQAVLSAQLVEHINRYIIPQWLAVNYPEFLAEGGTAKLIMQGFADEDTNFTNQIIQLVGQQQSGAQEISKIVDLERMLEARGTPIADFAVQKRREAQIAEEAAAAAAPAVEPAPGQVGVVPTGGPTGFSTAYIQPPEMIVLAESDEFMENLPPTPHYEDKTVRALTRQLRNQYRDLYRDEYNTLIDAFESGEEIELSDKNDDDVELAIAEATDFVKGVASKLWNRTIERTQDIFTKIGKRAAKVELGRSKIKAKLSQEELDAWIAQRIPEFAAKVAETTRSEVREFIAGKMREGITDRAELARLAREHFDEFPEWKADRVARTEVRNIYNAGTLLAAKAAGMELVQATDALRGKTDEHCEERDGKVYTINEAFLEPEHPNGTLGWRIVPISLSIDRVKEIASGEGAVYDAETHTLTLAEDVDESTERLILKSVVDNILEG